LVGIAGTLPSSANAPVCTVADSTASVAPAETSVVLHRDVSPVSKPSQKKPSAGHDTPASTAASASAPRTQVIAAGSHEYPDGHGHCLPA